MDDGVEDVPVDLAVADLRSFGQAGGAAGEDEAGDVFFVEGGAGYGRFLRSINHILVEQAALNPFAFDVDSG